MVFALFCAGHFGADARLGSSATARVTLFTITSRPHIQILCNEQVAYRMVPGDARSCFTCSDDQDPDDPVTFINTDIKAAFQEMCRQASFDTLTGKATQPHDDGLVPS